VRSGRLGDEVAELYLEFEAADADAISLFQGCFRYARAVDVYTVHTLQIRDEPRTILVREPTMMSAHIRQWQPYVAPRVSTKDHIRPCQLDDIATRLEDEPKRRKGAAGRRLLVTALLFFRCTVGSIWSLRRHDSSNLVDVHSIRTNRFLDPRCYSRTGSDKKGSPSCRLILNG